MPASPSHPHSDPLSGACSTLHSPDSCGFVICYSAPLWLLSNPPPPPSPIPSASVCPKQQRRAGTSPVLYFNFRVPGDLAPSWSRSSPQLLFSACSPSPDLGASLLLRAPSRRSELFSGPQQPTAHTERETARSSRKSSKSSSKSSKSSKSSSSSAASQSQSQCCQSHQGAPCSIRRLSVTRRRSPPHSGRRSSPALPQPALPQRSPAPQRSTCSTYPARAIPLHPHPRGYFRLSHPQQPQSPTDSSHHSARSLAILCPRHAPARTLQAP